MTVSDTRSRAAASSGQQIVGSSTQDPREGGDYTHLMCDRLQDTTLSQERRTILQTKYDVLSYGRGNAKEFGRYLSV